MGRAANDERTRVLVVDDNADVVDSLTAWLEMHDYRTERAYTGLQAISVFEHFRPDIVVLDLRMPEVDGFDVARKLRSLYGSGFTLVAHTACDDAGTRAQAREVGFDAHVPKDGRTHALDALLDAITMAESPFR